MLCLISIFKCVVKCIFFINIILGLEYFICYLCLVIVLCELVKVLVKCDLKIVGKWNNVMLLLFKILIKWLFFFMLNVVESMFIILLVIKWNFW